MIINADTSLVEFMSIPGLNAYYIPDATQTTLGLSGSFLLIRQYTVAYACSVTISNISIGFRSVIW
jgi:hypothetical protein